MIFKTLLKPIFSMELINDQHIHHHRFNHNLDTPTPPKA